MTEDISAQQTTVPDANSYAAIWAESLASVLGQIIGKDFPVSVSATGAEMPNDTDLYAIVNTSGGLQGEMALRIPEHTATLLARALLGETEGSTEYKPEYREAVEELLRQVAGRVATGLKSRWDETTVQVELGAAPTWPSAAEGWLVSASEANFRLNWRLSAALVAALEPKQSETIPPMPGVEAVPESELREDNLDLLMDVELKVSLRFGQRSMLLRDILQLGAGAVVELDRNIDEPVDLLLEGKVIARGEVVVIDGDYGLRVSEVIQPKLAGTA